MLRKFSTILMVILPMLFTYACTMEADENTSANDSMDLHHNEEIITQTIPGSAESPDPVLTKVTELERKGVLTNVIVMQSYPVRIRVTGPRNVIEELMKMKRKQLYVPE